MPDNTAPSPPKRSRAQLNIEVDRGWKRLVDKAVRKKGLKLKTLVVDAVSKELGITPIHA